MKMVGLDAKYRAPMLDLASHQVGEHMLAALGGALGADQWQRAVIDLRNQCRLENGLATYLPETAQGRGLHSPTSQLNLSRFGR